MVTDAVMGFMVSVVSAVVLLLPNGDPLDLPSLAPVWSLIAQVDSLIPVRGPLAAMLGVLSAGAAFMGLRMTLTVWSMVKR